MTGNAGNAATLRKATAARTAATAARADAALEAMLAAGEQVTFRALAARAGVSLDFLYRNTPVRDRVEKTRAAQSTALPTCPARREGPDEPSNVVRALTAQLADLRQRHRAEVAALREALAAAHGENLLLRRRLGPRASAPDDTEEDS